MQKLKLIMILSLFMLISAGLMACGMQGDLYLPEEGAEDTANK